MKKYNPSKIEKHWQRVWEDKKFFRARDFLKKRKQYILAEFPYPSGDGLHTGHVRTYTAMDVIARKRRMEGFNVLYPIGWDAFGLPTENYAIKTGIHPVKITKNNIAKFTKQIKSLGLSFDWSREINTADPEYYKWTQWIFLQLYKNGLAYKKKMLINWCSSCKIGLANEEVVDGKCERCGAETEKKDKEQWMLAITKYADRLDKDLDNVDFLEKIKIQQRNWIGRSEGVLIKFPIFSSAADPARWRDNFSTRGGSRPVAGQFSVDVFTTRVDTIFGATYLVVAPEHEIIKNLEYRIKNIEEVKNYIKEARRRSELERMNLLNGKSGVELKGVKAVNPATGEAIPIWTADYVLASYGAGAIMAVPAHDQRDFEFAQKYTLPVKMVICPNWPEPRCPILDKALEDDGHLVDSGKFTALTSEKARDEIAKWLSERGLGKKSVQYKLRDWVFSRQRYWGEPIPLVFCEHCAVKIKNQSRQGGTKIKNNEFSIGELLNPGWIAVSEDELPVKLPYLRNYKPTNTGESPLANIEKWVNVKCPKCGEKAKRETDVMPNWAGSSWYYLAYALGNQKSTPPFLKKERDKNQKLFWDFKKLNYWLPVDWYNGGMEHTTLHLLYSRFWHKFLYDIGLAPTSEPYKKRTSQGMVLASDGRKMSKSFNNVINPDNIVKQYGADALRLYEMFMGPFDQAIAWDSRALNGMHRFLSRVWDLQYKLKKTQNFNTHIINTKNVNYLFHKTIKKVSEDIEEMKFNTAIASLMILVNEMLSGKFQIQSVSWRTKIQIFLKLLASFAPHICEEIWHNLGNKKSIFQEKWPKHNPEFIREKTFELVIQINGKARAIISAKIGISEEEAKKIALDRVNIKKYAEGKEIKKIIFVKDRLVNIVI